MEARRLPPPQCPPWAHGWWVLGTAVLLDPGVGLGFRWAQMSAPEYSTAPPVGSSTGEGDGVPLAPSVCLNAAPFLGPSLGRMAQSPTGRHSAGCHGDPFRFLLKDDRFFQPVHPPGLPPFSALWEPRCPAPLPLLCATGSHLSGGSVLNHSPVSAGGVFWLEGEQQGQALEM